MFRTLALAAVALTALAGSAAAKCTLTLKLKNQNAAAITVLGSESQVKVNGGTWSKMQFNNVVVQPGATGTATWTTNMSCGGNAKRDFRIKYSDQGDNAQYQENFDNIDIHDGQTLNFTLEH
jgi:hypothetical protein